MTVSLSRGFTAVSQPCHFIEAVSRRSHDVFTLAWRFHDGFTTVSQRFHFIKAVSRRFHDGFATVSLYQGRFTTVSVCHGGFTTIPRRFHNGFSLSRRFHFLTTVPRRFHDGYTTVLIFTAVSRRFKFSRQFHESHDGFTTISP